MFEYLKAKIDNLGPNNIVIIKQASTLFTTSIFGIPIGLIINILITKLLGIEEYGNYMLMFSIYSLAVIFGTFGFFNSINRAIVLENNKEAQKEFYGASIIILIILSLLIGLITIMYGYFDSNIQSKNLFRLLFWSTQLLSILFIQKFLEVVLPASNDIYLLSRLRIEVKLILVTFLIITYYYYYEIHEAIYVIYLFIISRFFTLIMILRSLKFRMINLRLRLQQIISYNYSFGIHIYTGSIFAIGFSQMTNIFLSYYSINNNSLALYSLSLSFTLPLTLLPNLIATTYYKEFSSYKKIPSKIIIITLIISLLSIIILYVIIPYFIELVYDESFYPVIFLTRVLSIGAIFYGIGDVFNRFLSAKGKGVYIRNSAIFVGVSVFILNIVFIPKEKEYAAIWIYVIGGIIYFSNMLYFYTKTISDEHI